MAADTPVLVHNCGGTLTIHRFEPGEIGGVPHFTVEVVADKGARRHTERLGAAGERTIAVAHDPEGLVWVESRSIRVTDARSAIKFQDDSVSEGETGLYDYLTNSCFTYCRDVATHGGVQTSGIRDFAALFGWTYKDLMGR